MKRTVHIETLGCAKNTVDSENMMGVLTEAGYSKASSAEEADVIIVNTCAFIHDAKQESIDTILDLAAVKKGKLIMTGCLAQRYAAELLDEMPEVDAFVGTAQFPEIDRIIDELQESGDRIIQTNEIDRLLPDPMPRIRTSPPYTAYVKISEGCDNRCTYCIIPALRGRYRSRALEEIVAEARGMVREGVRELILIAQDSTRYGIDLNGKPQLAQLLEALNAIDDLRWIRVQYMYPDIIDRHLIETMVRLDKVVNYFDIPIQHASDAVLKRMNRHTTRSRIIEVVELIRSLAPDAVLRTTVIVGFPGETESDFRELTEFISAHPFNRLGAFTYSLEEETPAARLPGQIDEETKQQRHQELMTLQMAISEKLMSGFTGRTLDVLVEEKVEGEAIYIGRSAYDTPEVDGVVYIHTEKRLVIGEIVPVRITDYMEYDLIGEI